MRPFAVPLLAALAAGLCAAAPPAVTRNPLYAVPAGQFQDHHGDLTAAPSPDGPALSNAHAGDWAAYRAFDFDSGVAAFRATVSATAIGTVAVHLDQPDGPLLGSVAIPKTGTAPHEVACPVDHGQAGVRDVYLVFASADPSATMALRSFVFLKSIDGKGPPTDVSGRVDKADDEPQATAAWGMPQAGFTDDFTAGMTNWTANGFAVAHGVATAAGDASAFTPHVYLNKTDTGGEWRTMAQGSLAVDVAADDAASRPGVGFTSADGKQSVYVVLNAGGNALQAYRRLADGKVTPIRDHPKSPDDPKRDYDLAVGRTYRLKLCWSPYSDALIVFLSDATGRPMTSYRTVIDLPAARRPLLLNSGGPARFAHVAFDPRLDGWNYRWQWRKTPVLTGDVCNPAVWKWTDGSYYMVWRQFGGDTFHGIAASTDAVHWTRVAPQVMRCRGDMNVVVDPFGDGRVWVTPGGNKLPWWTSDGHDRFSHWDPSGKTVGDIHGNSRIQEIIDTAKFKQLAPVQLNGKAYRFIAFTENWTDRPQPHTVVMLSNTLTDWTVAEASPVLPPRNDFWGEKGSAIGSAVVLPDGNILLASCSCTNEGYTGAPEPTNVSVVVDGRQPWKIVRLATLPDAPVSRENVWYQGPNFGTAFLYEPSDDTLYYYGGFHDSAIGVMRVQGFLHGRATGTGQ